VGLFDLTQIALERALEGSAARQQALANNIANANTPGYQRVDVDFHRVIADAIDASQAGVLPPAQAGALVSPAEAALDAGPAAPDALVSPAEAALDAGPAASDAVSSLSSLDFTPQPDGSTAVSADGNTVSVDEETAQMSRNALDYQGIVAVEKARLHLLEIAIGGR
jgi:flagellar basal-body rod protein FlgB